MGSWTFRRAACSMLGTLFVATLWLLIAQPARAATARAVTVPVTNTLDAGPGSLRDAVAIAAPGDTVVFSPAVFNKPLTITLTSGYIEISKSLTIDGAYSGVITPIISGNGVTRIFRVRREAQVVSISGLVIANGYSGYDSGGGMVNDAWLTVRDIEFRHNRSEGDGGALYNSYEMQLTNVTFALNNAGDRGGAFINHGVITVTGGLITGNVAARGGGVANTAFLSVAGSAFSSNTATYGGGIYNAGIAEVTSAEFVSNSAGRGGGVYNGGTLTMAHSLLTDNNAPYGGGAYNGGTLVLVNSAVMTNSTNSPFVYMPDGGGVFNAGTLDVVQSVIASNSASRGGGVYNTVILRIFGGTLSGNTAGLYGGAVYNDNLAPGAATLSLEDSTLFSNAAGTTGGGVANTAGLVTLSNTTVVSNTAGAWGGGLANTNYDVGGYIRCGNLVAVNSTVADNSAGQGGGVFSQCPTTLTNTVMANSPSGVNCLDAGISTFIDGGHNLDSGNTCGFSAPGSLTNTDPLLGPLGNYGGPVMTIPLLPASPAIDAGDDAACPSTDARGVHRPQGVRCDIGAYEVIGWYRWMPIVRR